MAARKKTPAFAQYADRKPTLLINDFADWIEREVGMTLTERDRHILFVGSSLRGTFQKSPDNQKRIAAADARLKAEKEARIERAAERLNRSVEKATAAGAKVPRLLKPINEPATTPKRRRPVKTEAAQ